MTISLRRARLDDCEVVWRINFAPDVRAQSKDPREISLEEHTGWYRARMAGVDPTWIVEENGTAVGVVRLDRISEHSSRISIALSSDARGRQIGRQAIELACAHSLHPVVAEISRTNIASRRCFEACGFLLARIERELLTYQWSPSYEHGTARAVAV